MRSRLYVENKQKRTRSSKFWLLIFILLALIAAFIFTVISVVRQADRLMRQTPGDLPAFAANVMPAHDNLEFRSLDQSTGLRGWFMRGSDWPARGNVIFVHTNGSNRVQYGLSTADLFQYLNESGYNVLALDLRHSGKSEGELSAYGYVEYEDVLAAMSMAQKLTGQTDFILFGVGTGAAASLFAWQELPETGQKNQGRMADIEFSRQDIKAMIFDTPTASADDYIRADLPQQGPFAKYVWQNFVPAAVRMSAGSNHTKNLIPLYSQVQIPMMITRNMPDDKLAAGSIDSLIDERIRLAPGLTTVWETAEAGHLSGWQDNQEAFKQRLTEFLDFWSPRPESP